MGLSAVEICAGAGGQALGLELAGFEHELAVELDDNAADTLALNRPDWKVARGDVASSSVWNPAEYRGTDLLAGGVPCPPFSIAGKQLGASDERDLFAWAVETVGTVQPRAVMLENVRGLSMPRFAGYRQAVAERLSDLGYVSNWRLLHARDFGVSQLRPRFVLVALRPDDAEWFKWPEPQVEPPTVGALLKDLMSSNGWEGAANWAERANDIAPTIVGGSKKHGGADLGPTRAKAAWAKLGVDGKGVADSAPGRGADENHIPRLTIDMVSRIQGWLPNPDYKWTFSGKKTAQYRQVGNAFPPPVARAVGTAIREALERTGDKPSSAESLIQKTVHDPVLAELSRTRDWTPVSKLAGIWSSSGSRTSLVNHLNSLQKDFTLRERRVDGELELQLESFRAFTGQEDHLRHQIFARSTSQIS